MQRFPKKTPAKTLDQLMESVSLEFGGSSESFLQSQGGLQSTSD